MRCGAVRCGAVRCGAVRCGAVRCGAVRCGAVRCGAVRCGAVRHGVFKFVFLQTWILWNRGNITQLWYYVNRKQEILIYDMCNNSNSA